MIHHQFVSICVAGRRHGSRQIIFRVDVAEAKAVAKAVAEVEAVTRFIELIETDRLIANPLLRGGIQ
jgi:hypothetical protein